MKNLTVKDLKETMSYLYHNENGHEDYDKLWDAIRTLSALGLIDRKFADIAYECDHELFLGDDIIKLH